MSSIDTVIIGAGQAGLALSRLLTDARHDHVVLERGRVGERWRSERWDSLALLTPNWANRLPFDDEPDEPDAYASSSEFVARLQRYSRSFGAPVHEGTTATAVERSGSGFDVRTDRGEWRARNVVVASGDCAVPAVPWFAGSAPAAVEQLHASSLSRAGLAGHPVACWWSAPDRAVTRSPTSFARAGRRVVLAVGRHARIVRRYRGRDVWAWLDALGELSRTLDDLPRHARSRPRPGPAARRPRGRPNGRPRRARGGRRALGRTPRGLRRAATRCSNPGWRRASRTPTRVSAACSAASTTTSIHVSTRRRLRPASTSRPFRRLPRAHDRPRGRGHLDDRLGDGVPAPLPVAADPRGHRQRRRHPPRPGRTAVPGLFVLGMRWQYRMTSHQIGGVGADAAFLAEQIAPGADGRRVLRAAA
jgi:putative flavoprotein involved in K+ transport